MASGWPPHPAPSTASPCGSRSTTVRECSARWPSAIGEAGGTIGAVDLVQVDETHTIRDITVETGDAADWPRLTDAVNAVDGARVLDTTDRTFMLHVGGKIEHAQQEPAEDARRPLDGLHARRGPRLHGDPRGSRQGLPVHDQAQHGRRRLRRDGGARARRHRPAGGDAGDGGQGDAVQGVRRRRRVPDLPGHAATRTRSWPSSRRSRPASAASTSRTSRPRAASRSRTGCKAELDIPVFHDDQHGTAVVVLAALLQRADA